MITYIMSTIYYELYNTTHDNVVLKKIDRLKLILKECKYGDELFLSTIEDIIGVYNKTHSLIYDKEIIYWKKLYNISKPTKTIKRNTIFEHIY